MLYEGRRIPQFHYVDVSQVSLEIAHFVRDVFYLSEALIFLRRRLIDLFGGLKFLFLIKDA